MAAAVGIVGASGYGGAELARLLADHPGLSLEVLAAHSQADARVGDLFPNLTGAGRFDGVAVDVLADLDLVFLATPHLPAAELAAEILEGGARVVDLSGGHRLEAGAFARWYGQAHPHPHLLPAVYGLTEHNRGDIAEARLVANPGCYPTAALLALLPLADLIDPGGVVIDAKSGTSGAGRGLADSLHFSHVHGDLTAYGAPRHRHTIEIESRFESLSGLTDVGAISFTPHLVPMSRGLLATCYAPLGEAVTGDDVQQALVDAYADEPFVEVLEPGSFPHTKAVAGSNGCHLSAVADPRTGRVVVTGAIDNLGKGAAGQALQNANVMLGLEEGAALGAVGVYP